MYDALLAAYGQWLTGYVSLRGIDAHRRDDGDAVRRAVCSMVKVPIYPNFPGHDSS